MSDIVRRKIANFQVTSLRNAKSYRGMFGVLVDSLPNWQAILDNETEKLQINSNELGRLIYYCTQGR